MIEELIVRAVMAERDATLERWLQARLALAGRRRAPAPYRGDQTRRGRLRAPLAGILKLGRAYRR
jgi:hypothetical protein